MSKKVAKARAKINNVPDGVQASLDTTRSLMKTWRTDLELLSAVTVAVQAECVNLAQFAEWMPQNTEA